MACIEAEAKARATDDLQAKLDAAEEVLKEAREEVKAMKEKLDRVDTREADLIKRMDEQSEKFGGSFSFLKIPLLRLELSFGWY